MTTPPSWTPPPVPGQQPEPTSYWPPQQNPPAPKTTRQRLIIAGALVLGVVGGGFALAAADKGPTPAAKPAAQTVWDREQAQRKIAGTVEPTTEPPLATPEATLAASDMTLSLKTTEKHCFGSAGCNVTVTVQAKRNAGVPKPDPNDTFVVTYEITGVEDGPVIGTFEISGGTYEVNEESLSTKSSKSKPKIRITDIEKRGL